MNKLQDYHSNGEPNGKSNMNLETQVMCELLLLMLGVGVMTLCGYAGG